MKKRVLGEMSGTGGGISVSRYKCSVMKTPNNP